VSPPNRVAQALEPIGRWCAIACGWWLTAVAGLTCVEIVGRKLFGFSLQGVDEVAAYTLAVVSALSFSYALIIRSHTRIDFLVAKLPAGPRAALNAAAMISLAAFAAFAAWRGTDVLKESLEFRSRSTSPLQTPLWMPQGPWLAGLFLFAAVALALAVHATLLLVRDRERLNVLYGPPTLDEEIEREMAGAVEAPKEAL
jgi:TRAP-type C4-dicarboxylate transport system permease small subunit